MLKKSNQIVVALLTSATVLAAMPAASATVNVEKTFTNTFGPSVDQRWYEATSFVALGTTKNNVAAGVFRLTDTNAGGLGDFLAFCLQPLEVLSIPKPYEIGSNFSAAITANLNILASNAWDKVTDKKTAAAFQMAAWEITTENSGSFNINSGGFKITGTSTGSVNAALLAQDWLTKITNSTWGPTTDQFVILNAPGTQDLLTNVAAVPVPAAGLLMLGGLASLGGMRRRQKRQS